MDILQTMMHKTTTRNATQILIPQMSTQQLMQYHEPQYTMDNDTMIINQESSFYTSSDFYFNISMHTFLINDT